MTKAQKPNKAQNPFTPLQDVKESDIDEIMKYRKFREGEIDIAKVKLKNAIVAFRKLNRAIEEEIAYFKMLKSVKNSITSLSRKVADLHAFSHRRIEDLYAVIEVDRNFNPREITDWSIKEFAQGTLKLVNSIHGAIDSKPRKNDNRSIVWFVAQLNDIIEQHSDGDLIRQSIKNQKNLDNDRTFTIAALQLAEPTHYYLSDPVSGKIQGEKSRVSAIRKDKAFKKTLKKLLSEIRSSMLLKNKDNPDSIESAMKFFEQELNKKLRNPS
jgi:hypothetical protein